MAETSVSGWREVTAPPAPPPPSRWTPLLGPAMLLGFALLLAWSGRRRLPALLAAFAVAFALAVILSPSVRAWTRRIERAIAGAVGPVIAWVVLFPVYLLLMTPVALVLRLLHVRPLERGTDRNASSLWFRARAQPHDTSTRMFSDERAWRPDVPTRSGRPVIARTVVAVLVIEALIVAAVVLVMDRRTPEPEFAGAGAGAGAAGPAESAALRDLPWIQEMMSDEAAATRGIVYAPFVGTTLRDYRGQHVNVTDRARKTYEPAPIPGVRPIDVWFFGGSTMFGFEAQRDMHTIPSEFVRLAEQAGIPVRARNYGSPGYVNYQETMLLSLLVSAGEWPDLVIFYDGINDMSLQMLNAVGGLNPLGEPSDLGASYRRTEMFESGSANGGSAAPPGPLTSNHEVPVTADDLVGAVEQVYRQGMDVSSALARQHDFDVEYYWQPTVYTKANLDPGERVLLPGLGLDGFRFEAMRALARRMLDHLPPGVVDITDALDHVRGPVLADNVHINEVGARAVAQAMFDNSRPTLERLRSPG